MKPTIFIRGDKYFYRLEFGFVKEKRFDISIHKLSIGIIIICCCCGRRHCGCRRTTTIAATTAATIAPSAAFGSLRRNDSIEREVGHERGIVVIVGMQLAVAVVAASRRDLD